MLTISCVFSFIIIGMMLVIGRIVSLMFVRRNKAFSSQTRTHPAKTMIILGSGGHTAEMLKIVEHLNVNNYSPRLYLHASTDRLSPKKVLELESNNFDYKIKEIFRSREVRQSYFTSVWTTLHATFSCIPLVWRERPELILCNGPGTCVPICIIAFFLKVICVLRVKIIFIESFCRVKTFSLTGKILYYIADHVIVQWPYLRPSSTGITTFIPWELLQEDFKYVSNECRPHLIHIVNVLRRSFVKETMLSTKWIEDSNVRMDACLDRTWEALNSGYWKNISIEYRYTYTLCTLLKAVLLELQSERSKSKNAEIEELKEIIKFIDKGILLGAPLPSAPNLLTTIASKINDRCNASNKTNLQLKDSLSRNDTYDDNIHESLLPGFTAVNNYEKPSMELFYTNIFQPKRPAVLRGCIQHWKALELWKDLDYLIKVVGNRTVPIEIGSRYTEDDWSQRLVMFSEYVQRHILQKESDTGYLAQHELFEQVPELKSDFTVPEYCSFSDNEESEQPDINAWFGPAGTVSPLHFDPKNNLLCQIVGFKRVILYDPEDTLKLYPYDSRLLNNTAQVDPINPNYDKWPNFRNARGYMCYLRPGDMLFIPPRWWHHVTSLTQSFSVSFWWA